ncbi:uncharacterized protein BP01DRAFT_82551 [Aspergillus saccharolyticus JOP 1030-1]|uniref:PRISE-like Rossmann-fold domain-containing protein n=1 Tax=Aspergillus saccharolyticus JOP 1030-1 TaxID=1450539 RepID=A0A318ZAF2_9EURO|nr:hypothetical protein BP01DRAFT_82551 [Aspergillus saccharolyticus JOP 1030-1]PYH44415.1 hypothetical protein BP01DRAFT_82551 [Aspergillus saccharolyticus JOP 1030-1]
MATESHAIVFGAAGLLGWATLNQLLSGYPSSSPFSRVTAVLNRPVSEPDLCLPSGPNRPSFELVSGINLLEADGDDLAKQLKEKVPDVEGITHVFYFVFAPFNDDHIQECTQNCGIMQRLADAMNIVAPKLRSFVYPGGSRGYGIYIPGGVFHPPLEESMADSIPADYAKTVAYPWFRKILTEASKDRNWTWSEVCPDAVVGFSPNGSGYSLALHWAQYLSLYAYNHRGSTNEEIEVPFPGSEAGYRSLYTPVSGEILGRIAIHAALHPESCGGKIINMLDNDTPVSASDLWPRIAAWFGLKGVGPAADDDALKPSEYIDKNRHLFAQDGAPKGVTCGVGIGNKQLDSVGWWLTFDRHFSPKRLRTVGFTEQRDPVNGWLDAFERFREAGIIF